MYVPSIKNQAIGFINHPVATRQVLEILPYTATCHKIISYPEGQMQSIQKKFALSSANP